MAMLTGGPSGLRIRRSRSVPTDRADWSEASFPMTSVDEALYEVPYLAHLTMEPPNCTARVAEGRVDVWAPTQVPGLARAVAAQVAGVPPEAVTVDVTYLGGGFGRRLEVDLVAQAVRIALETGGRPVQLVWPRDEDLAHDFYRPAAAAWMRAGFDEQGALVALAIIAAVMSSIGAVIGTTVKGTRFIDQRLALTGSAETVLAALPARNALKPGRQAGEVAGHRWRLDVTPWYASPADAPKSRFVPLIVNMQMQAPGGSAMVVSTVRLVPKAVE